MRARDSAIGQSCMPKNRTTSLLLIGTGVVIALTTLYIAPESPQTAQTPIQGNATITTLVRVEQAEVIDVDSYVGDDHISTSMPTLTPTQQASLAPAGGDFEDNTPSSTRKLDKVPIPIYTEGTVLSAMEALQAASSTFRFSGSRFLGLGLYVEEINSIPAAQGAFWILYINGTPATSGASTAQVQPGDTVEWRYEESIY